MTKKYHILTLSLALAISASMTICSAAATESAANTAATNGQAISSDWNGSVPPMPPDGFNPPGPPPDGAGPGMSQEAASADSLKGARIYDADKASLESETLSSHSADENTVLLRNGAVLTMSRSVLNKQGDSSSMDDSNFSGKNAVFLSNNSTAALNDLTITSDAEGANAIFSTGKSSKITVKNTKIHTMKSSSRGLDATYGGTIIADTIEINTEGAHCAALATDRGEGNVTVTNGIFATAGDGSPCIYSTGNIQAAASKGIATNSEIAVVEGKNSIRLETCDLTGNAKHGVMLYQSFSGDAGTGTAHFSAKDSTLTNLSTGSMFYITNTQAEISLENTTLHSPHTDTLIELASDRWGQTGSNGGDLTFTAAHQQLSGDVMANCLSQVRLTLRDNTSWTGALNHERTAKEASLSLDASSHWTLTADSWVTSLSDKDTNFSNIQSNGHILYYDASVSTSLKHQTFSLPGGGQLKPAA